jgi:hypothetical protein
MHRVLEGIRARVRALCAVGVSLGVLSQPPSLCAQAVGSPPERWVGTWRGTLQNLGAGDSVKITVPVTLTIARTSDPAAFRWRHVYANDSTKNVKDYTLKVS